MYREFYKLNLKPFQISPDHRFLWMGEKHKEALAVLQYGILDNKGFLLLTGDVGTGKTTLLNALIDSLPENVMIALISDPGLGKMDFFKFVADAFELDRNFKSKGDFLLELRNYLFEMYRQEKQTLLIIDECQHLTQKLLEEVRLLSNIEKYDTKLINIFFVGQSEFNEIILRPRNRAIRQRITINYNINALSESETDKYIRFRLGIAGAQERIFTSRAIKEVYKFSNGYPRLINIICDQALLTGFAREKRKIDRKTIAECADELKISHGISRKKSLATPEAAEQNLVEPSDPDMPIEIALEPGNRKLSMPLVAAFFVVLIIWIGLVATFFLNRQSTTANPIEEKTVFHTTESSHISAAEIQDSTPTAISGEQPEQESIDGSNQMTVSKGDPQQSPVSEKDPGEQPDGGEAFTTEPQQSIPIIVPPVSAQPDKKTTIDQIQANFGTYPEIKFGFNSNSLDNESYDMLDIIARYCLQNPEMSIVLRGYTDASGMRTYNIKLSEFRAGMVKTYLVGRGVDAQAIKTLAIGPGTEGPGGTTMPHDGNRRKVVIEIIPPGE